MDNNKPVPVQNADGTFSVSCGQEGCGTNFTHTKATVTLRMRGMHLRKHHGILGREAQYVKRRGGKPYNRKARTTRPYTRRAETEAASPQATGCNNCPNCGYPLALHSKTYNTIQKLTT